MLYATFSHNQIEVDEAQLSSAQKVVNFIKKISMGKRFRMIEEKLYRKIVYLQALNMNE